MKPSPLTFLAAAAALALAGPAAADETTFCNAYITSLPFTIATQGHYCFDRNLSTAIASGSAITINADFVVLDLNNFKLGGGAAGLATTTIGVRSIDHRNITVRNGNIRGFRYGISLEGSASTSGGHVIENNVLDGNTQVGARADGDAVVMRTNVVSNTGAAVLGPYSSFALWGSDDTFMSTRDNVLVNTMGEYYAAGICCGAGQHDHNLIKMGATLGRRQAIFGQGELVTACRDNTVFDASPGDAFIECSQVGHNYNNP